MIHYTNTTAYDYSGRKRTKRKAKGEVYEKFKPEFRPLSRPLYSYRTNRDQYQSFDSGRMNVEKKENTKYTGTLVKGISTLHKSNAVPIIDEREAKEHANMRR